MIGVLDYNAGNLTSVQSALHYCKAKFTILSRPEDFLHIDRLIVPGVGEARAAMEYLQNNGLDQAIMEFCQTGKPFLGICLGSQIILDFSQERDTSCLGLMPGTCKSFSLTYGEKGISPRDFKVPHIGWNQVSWPEGKEDYLFQGIPHGRSFYFDHGYYNSPLSKDHVLGTSDHGISFPAVIGFENIRAVQFHPEKSGAYGLRLLGNFCLKQPGDR